jgi:uncharacterized protein (TIGR02118 family)
MTLEEFQTYWREMHAPLVKKFAPKIGMVRYIQVHTRPPAVPREDPLRGPMLEPFDGVAEIWIDSSKATGTDEERREAARALAEDEANFIDFASSTMTRGEELYMIGVDTPL